LFSATFSETIEKLSQHYQRNPVRVFMKDEEPLKIEENIFVMERERKLPTLLSILESEKPESTMVFCNMKIQVDEVSKRLQEKEIRSESLHGDLEQNDRQKVLAKFRNRTISVLVATDVAARGIDITGVDMVINFDMPSIPEIYVHRIGRTGRAGKKGRALSFLMPTENKKIEGIEEFTKKTLVRSTWKEPTVKAPVVKTSPLEMLYIGGGRKQKLRPSDILGALTQAAGLPGTDVGKIEIHDNHTYVAVKKTYAMVAVNGLKKAGLKGRKFPVGIVA
jgi:ATP-independent RNA helicase DbpA